MIRRKKNNKDLMKQSTGDKVAEMQNPGHEQQECRDFWSNKGG